MLRMIHRTYQTHSQGTVIIKRLPKIATNPRHRASHPLPTNTTSCLGIEIFRQNHRINAVATQAQPMMV